MNSGEALDLLLPEYGPFFERLCIHYLQRTGPVQDTLHEAYRKFSQCDRVFETREDALRYFCRLLSNHCIDVFRQEKLDRQRHVGDCIDTLISDRENPERAMIRQQKENQMNTMATLVREKVAQLPPHEREVLYMVFFRDPPFSFAQVSAKLRIPITTVRSRVNRAIGKIRANCHSIVVEWQKY